MAQTFRWEINSAGSFTWNAPTGVTSVKVELWGGGGPGGTASVNGGGGGGGGEYRRDDAYTVTPGNAYTVVVGAGGVTGAGSASTFDTTGVVANGGSAGGNGSGVGGQGDGGLGGTGGTGPTGFNGGAGGGGAAVQTNGGGGGGGAGDAAVGGAGASNRTAGTGGNAGGGAGGIGGGGGGSASAAGVAPGGGGGGASTLNARSSGARGKAIITWVQDTDVATASDAFSRTVGFVRRIGTSVADDSTNNDHGTVVGHPSVVASPWSGFGDAIDFAGTNLGDSTEGVTGPVLQFSGTSPFTIECRFRRDGSGNDQHLAGVWKVNTAAGTSTLYRLIYNNASDRLQFNVVNASNQIKTITALAASSVGTTYVARGVYDGTNIHMYIDGTRQGTLALGGSLKTGDGTTPLTIGRGTHGNDVSSPTPFNGVIDEVRVSDIARSTGASYTVDTAPFEPDANTLVLYHMDGIGELVETTDVASLSVGFNRTFSDTATPTDAPVLSPTLNKADTVTASEAVDSLTVVKNLADSVTADDDFTRVLVFNRTFSDSVTAVDAPVKNITLNFADDLGAAASEVVVIAPIFD